MVIGTVLFVMGRFLGTWLMTRIKDHKLLTTYGLAATLLCLVGVFASGEVAVYSVLGLNLFMSVMFPTIFALGIRDLGEQTKLGSSFIIMAIVGGAIIPPLMGVVADEVGIQESLLFPCVCFLFVTLYGWKGYNAKPVNA